MNACWRRGWRTACAVIDCSWGQWRNVFTALAPFTTPTELPRLGLGPLLQVEINPCKPSVPLARAVLVNTWTVLVQHWLPSQDTTIRLQIQPCVITGLVISTAFFSSLLVRGLAAAAHDESGDQAQNHAETDGENRDDDDHSCGWI